MHRHLGRTAQVSDGGAGHSNKWYMLFLLPGWVLLSFVASQVVVIGLLWTLDFLKASPEQYLNQAALQTILSTIVYVLAISIAIGLPYLVRKRPTSLRTLGLSRLPTWGDIGLSPLAFVAYAIIVSIVIALLSQIPGFPADQAQDVGFKAFGSRMDTMLAFLTLVVLAPVAEETLFRGYLYGKLNKHVPVVVAAVATSLLFALVHMQLNVGVDVFILSLVLCGLRSLTGSIWAGILVHMIKNGIAYYLLFISPLIGG